MCACIFVGISLVIDMRVVFVVVMFFFFKQKTAYEMRISDWSSDVCSSDLHGVKQIDPVGQPFNPDFHQAMTMAPSTDVPANHVLSVMQKGYSLHDRLLRPAKIGRAHV